MLILSVVGRQLNLNISQIFCRYIDVTTCSECRKIKYCVYTQYFFKALYVASFGYGDLLTTAATQDSAKKQSDGVDGCGYDINPISAHNIKIDARHTP